MARIDLKHKVVHAKLVYYGPGLCGKTTNLEYVAKNLGGANGSELMSLATEGDRTIFFDFLPLDLGTLRGLTVQFKLYTVPGQVRYQETRKMVLKNVDGIVFVADSQEMMMDANLQSLEDLYANLKVLGIDHEKLPILLQYNKRDLPTAVPTGELDKALNSRRYPTFAASARTGEGVVETLKAACGQVLKALAVDLPENRGDARQKPVASGASAAKTQVAAPEPTPAQAAGPSAASNLRASANGHDERSPAERRAEHHESPARASPPPAHPSPEPMSKEQLDAGIEKLMGSLATKGALTELEAALQRRLDALAATMQRPEAPAAALDTSALRDAIAQLTSARQADLDALDARLSRTQKEAVTKDDLAALSQRIDALAASVRSQPPPEESPGKLAQLIAANEASFNALEARLSRLPKDVEALLAQNAADVRELLAELAALKEARSPHPAGPDASMLARLATKDDVAALERRLAQKDDVAALELRLAQIPERSEIEAWSRSMGELLAAARAVQTSIGELCAANERAATTAGLEAIEHRVAELAERVAHPPARGRRRASEAPTRVPPPLVGAEADQAFHASLAAPVAHAAPPPAASPPMTPAPPTRSWRTPPPPTPPQQAPVEVQVEAPPAAATPPPPAPVTPPPPAETKAVEAAVEEPLKEARPEAPPAEAQAEEAPAEAAPAGAAPATAEAPVAPPAQAEPAPVAPPAQAEPAPVAPPAQAEPAPVAPPAQAAQAEPPPNDERHVNAARVARVMVADLVLYHKEAVEAGVRQDDFFERNKEALADMRATYESRVPRDIRDQSDYLEKAIRELVAKKRTQLGLG